jgi:predicted amidohydrolase
MTGQFKIATAQYPIGSPADWSEYETKIRAWVAQATEANASLLVFPEYFSMELVHLFPENIQKSLGLQLDALQTLKERFIKLFGDLALQHGVHIVAGSFPIKDTDGLFRNRSYLFFPDGHHKHQDKVQMTRFENEQWGISPGHHLRTFETSLGRIAINICYDSEFPILARRQVEAGADLIVVPSCTDTVAGYWRVRIGCQARALENQCYVVQSPTVGHAPWSEAVDVNIGAAAVYTPVDYGFPDNGVLSIGDRDQPQWVYAEVDLGNIAHIRNHGQVFNHRDWPAQFRTLDAH